MCSFFRKQGWENSNLWVPEHQITTTLQQKPWRPTCHLWQILTCMTSLLNHSPTALLYSKTKFFHGIQCSCIQCSSTAIMWNKICWKNKTKKKRTAKVQMFRAVGCNQKHFQQSGASHESNYEFTSQTWFAAHVSTRSSRGG